MSEQEATSPEPSLVPVLYRGAAHPLARFKDSKSVRLLADRLIATDKSDHGLTFDEAITIGQAALAKGLSPFEPRKELHYWIDVPKSGARKGQRQLTIMDAAVGVIRLSEEAARHDGTYIEDPRFEIIADAKEKGKQGFQPDDLVVRCEVSDHRSISEYYKRRVQLKDEGLSTEDVDDRLGKRGPALVGFGAMSVDEMKKIDFWPSGDRRRNTYPHINRTKKRAYTAALVQRWSALVNIQRLEEASANLTDDQFIIDGEWRDVRIEDPEELAKKADEANETLFGADPDPQPPASTDTANPASWPVETIKHLKDAGIVPKNIANKHLINNTLEKSVFADRRDAPKEHVAAWLLHYKNLRAKGTSDEMDPESAALAANLKITDQLGGIEK